MPDTARPSALWRRGQEGWPRRFPLAQFPNAPLLVYLLAVVVDRLSDDRSLHEWAWAVSRVALTVWAYEEARRGVNWFRRALGIAVLVATVAGLADDLG